MLNLKIKDIIDFVKRNKKDNTDSFDCKISFNYQNSQAEDFLFDIDYNEISFAISITNEDLKNSLHFTSNFSREEDYGVFFSLLKMFVGE